MVDELESTLGEEIPEPYWREHLRRRVLNGETIQRGDYYVDAR